MTRKTKVGLEVDEAPFVRGMKRAEDAAEGLDDALDDLGDSARDTTVSTERAKESTEDLGDSARETGRDLGSLRADAARLDRQIDETASSVRELARAIAATGDEAERAKLAEKLTIERSRLRQRVDLRKLIDFKAADDVGAELASQVSVSFAARLGPLLARAPMAGMNPAVAAIAAPLVGGLVTLIGAGVGGAIVGGVGLGGVAGGLAVAARDPQVQSAGRQFAREVGEMLDRAAAPTMTPAAVQAITRLRAEALRAEPDVTRLFAGAARLTPIFVDGLSDAAHNMLPGLVDAIEAGEPAARAIARGLADIGDAVGDGLSDLAEYADEGARALSVLLNIVEGGIRIVFGFLKVTSEAYAQGEILGAFLSGDLSRGFALIADREATAAAQGSDLAAEFDKVGGAAGGAANETDALVAALDALNGIQLSVNEAERAFQESVDEAREAFDKKVSSIDLGTERGRTYSEALDSIATSARESAQAIYDQTESTTQANAKIEEGRQALIRQAEKYGLSKRAAREYADSVLSVPKQWQTRLDVNTAEAIAELRGYNRWLANIPRTVRTRMIVEQQTARGGHREFATGGPIDGPGPKGVDSELIWAAPGEHMLSAREVDAAGGHAAIERWRASLRSGTASAMGNPATSGAHRYGSPAPGRAATAASAGPSVLEAHIEIGGEVVRVVRTELREHDRGLRRRALAGARTVA